MILYSGDAAMKPSQVLEKKPNDAVFMLTNLAHSLVRNERDNVAVGFLSDPSGLPRVSVSQSSSRRPDPTQDSEESFQLDSRNIHTEAFTMNSLSARSDPQPTKSEESEDLQLDFDSIHRIASKYYKNKYPT